MEDFSEGNSIDKGNQLIIVKGKDLKEETKKNIILYFETLPIELWHDILTFLVKNFTDLLFISTISKSWQRIVLESTLWFHCELILERKKSSLQNHNFLTFTTRGQEECDALLYSKEVTFDRCFRLVIQRKQPRRMEVSEFEHAEVEELGNFQANHPDDFLDHRHFNTISEEDHQDEDEFLLNRQNHHQNIQKLKHYLVDMKFRFHSLWDINLFFHSYTFQLLQFLQQMEEVCSQYRVAFFGCLVGVILLGTWLFPHTLQLLLLLIYGYFFLFHSFQLLCQLACSHFYWFGSFFHLSYQLIAMGLLTRYYFPLFLKTLLSYLYTLLTNFPILNHYLSPLPLPLWSDMCYNIAAYYHNFSIFHMLIIFVINSPIFKSIFLIPFILQKFINAYLIYPFTLYISQEFDHHSSSNDSPPTSSISSSEQQLTWLFYGTLIQFVLPIIHWLKLFQILQILTYFYSFYMKYAQTPGEIMNYPRSIFYILWTWMRSICQQISALCLGSCLMLTLITFAYKTRDEFVGEGGGGGATAVGTFPVFGFTKQMSFIFLFGELILMMTFTGIISLLKESSSSKNEYQDQRLAIQEIQWVNLFIIGVLV